MMQNEELFNVVIKGFTVWNRLRLTVINNYKKHNAPTPLYNVLIKYMISYFKQYNTVPTFEDIKLTFKTSKKFNHLDIFELINTVKNVNIDNYSENNIILNFIDDITRSNTRAGVLKAIETANSDKPLDSNLLTDTISKYTKLNIPDETNKIHYNDGNDVVRLEMLRNSMKSDFKTGISDKLDDVLKLKRKTMVAVSAGSGVGKSLFLSNAAFRMARYRHNVLYFSLEMDEVSVSNRIDMMQYGFTDYGYSYNIDEFIKRRDNFRKQYPSRGIFDIISRSPRSLTSNEINSILNQYKSDGINIDVIFVDYITLMKPNVNSKNTNSYDNGKFVAEELKKIANDWNCLVFTAAQINRDSYLKKHQGVESLSESLAISQLLDTLINMQPIIDEETGVKYYKIEFPKLRSNRGMIGNLFLKLQDDLKIVPTTDTENDMIENTINVVKSYKKKLSNDIDLGGIL